MPTTECTDKATGQAALLGFFGLREQPFGVTPDPRLLYLTNSHREALASLIYAIEMKRGFSALIAEPGMGKTTLLFYLLGKLKATARTAFLFRPDSNTKELLQSLLLDLGVVSTPQEVPQMHETLNSVLLQDLRAGKHFVWVLDEAQDLDNQVLESVRLLSNFETPVSKLMHIVLAGQPGLADKLARPELLQLRQRVSTVTRLTPLSPRETSDYIQHRTRWAGCKNPDLFLPESRALIAQCSMGIPRNINNLCFASLSLGFVENCRAIPAEIVRKVLEDPAFEMIASRSPSPAPASTSPPNALPAWPGTLLQEDWRQDFSAKGGGWSPFWTAIAALGFLGIPILLVMLSSSSRIRALEAVREPAAEDFVQRVTGYNVHIPDLPETQPPSLQAPKPPALLPVAEKPKESAAPATPPAISPATKPVVTRKQAKAVTERPLAREASSGPRIVYTNGGENLFQLALQYYGKSNWTIVTKIRAQNPRFSDPYTVFGQRDRVVLPDLSPEYPWKDLTARAK